MKTIVYLLIAVFTIGIFANSFIKISKTNQSIIIQSSDKISSATLNQSGTIIANRLKSFCAEKFEIFVIPSKNQIEVKLDNKWDLKIAGNLIIHKGSFEFYETYNYKNLKELLKGDEHLLSFFNMKSLDENKSEIGCTSLSEVKRVNDYITTLGLTNSCKFAWSNLFENSKACLYALKLNNDNKVLLKGSDIEEFKVDQDLEYKKDYILIRFKMQAVELWAEFTKRNIDKDIAIVLDNCVLCAPKVRSEITGGNCQISGIFTQNELKFIAAIGNGGELPANFYEVK
jgi:SecD/SecF fusion protein